ncbi:PAS domain-containing protein, partial [Clostridium perfringens]
APGAAAAAHRELFTYWTSLRRDGRLPGRRGLDPAAMKGLLPTVSLIDVQRRPLRNSYRMRLAGTELYTVYGGEITG